MTYFTIFAFVVDCFAHYFMGCDFCKSLHWLGLAGLVVELELA